MSVQELSDHSAARPVTAADAAAPGSSRLRLRELVTEILAAQSQERPFSDDDTLVEIGITSVDMVTLLLAVESAFDIEVPQHEITAETFRSVATVDAMLSRLGCSAA